MAYDAQIGRHLAILRERAGLKQNELAKRLEWSAAVLSRVETGERGLADDELAMILKGIDTPEATQLAEALRRDWKVLHKPDLGDADMDLLWEAEQVAQRVHSLAESPDVRQFFVRQLERYKDELTNAAARVTRKAYQVAFLGTIAVGKSTAICRAEALELPSAKGMPKAVLETGAGGITICEVHIRRGPGYGLIVEPCADDEIRRYVADFADFLLNASPTAVADDDSGAGAPGISREIERALRNMTDLRRRRAEKKSDGSVVPAFDRARSLAGSTGNVRDLAVEILALMRLHQRDRRDVWYSETSGKPPLEWLQEEFERVNNGRHPEFTLPKRIELVIPSAILGDESLSVTLIDTQGIDDIAERADLEQHFDDAHTVVLLCTLFNQAPQTEVRRLLQRAKEAGVRTLGTNAALVVLPRPGDALAMKDNGYPVDSASDGCALKSEEVDLKLHELGLTGLERMFFNSAEDEPEVLREFVAARIAAVQDAHRRSLREIVEGANSLVSNYRRAQTREVMARAARSMTTWLAHNAELSGIDGHTHDSLLEAVGNSHPRTIHATVVREGAWPRLDFGHQLSHGARRIATKLLEAKLRDFRAIVNNILQDDQLSEAHDLARQVARTVDDGFDSVLRRAQLVGQSIHADEMSADAEFWRSCRDEWGTGKFYRDRINGHNRTWFEEAHGGDADVRVLGLVKQGWSDTVNAVRQLLTQDEGDHVAPTAAGGTHVDA